MEELIQLSEGGIRYPGSVTTFGIMNLKLLDVTKIPSGK